MMYTLRYAILKLNLKGVEIYKRNFLETYLALAYFRIPAYRNLFLEKLLIKSDYDIEEWRASEWDISTY